MDMYEAFIYIGGTTSLVMALYLLYSRKERVHKEKVHEEIRVIRAKLKDVEERNLVFEAEILSMKKTINNLTEELDRYRYLYEQEQIMRAESIDILPELEQ